MSLIVRETTTQHTPESLVRRLGGARGVVLLRSALFDSPHARYSFVAANPFLTFRSFGSRCEVTQHATRNTQDTQYGNPWQLLDALMARCELLDEVDLPFPLGGCFGYWGYDLKNFTEPKLPRRAVNDLELPDCHVGFYGSLVVFDHRLGKTWIVSTGLEPDGARSEARATGQCDFWRGLLEGAERLSSDEPTPDTSQEGNLSAALSRARLQSNLSRAEFIAAVEGAQRYIRAGDIYQVNLSHRIAAPCAFDGWQLFNRLLDVSPAPFAAYLDCGDFQVASSSPEQFLHLSGSNIQTRPIKGTRPRSSDATRDAQLAYELQTSPKELAELVMITDLLRNDLGKVCEYGSVRVPELAKLERYPQVQHLVSTVEGRLRAGVTHFAALASCFPGGSITGAPKIRAMEIIDELEPVSRGPYCGCHGYLGFNRESQLSISIRTAVLREGTAYFHAGAGIVADSIPEAEHDETLAKAAGFVAALKLADASPKLHDAPR
ncbi:MAG TPA: anthranilate synthase component I family protein [Verrucomicrobiota bacterium]|nr:anthranilate synthase component I family protein [Verrucomicrobiota bacterium]